MRLPPGARTVDDLNQLTGAWWVRLLPLSRRYFSEVIGESPAGSRLNVLLAPVGAPSFNRKQAGHTASLFAAVSLMHAGNQLSDGQDQRLAAPAVARAFALGDQNLSVLVDGGR